MLFFDICKSSGKKVQKKYSDGWNYRLSKCFLGLVLQHYAAGMLVANQNDLYAPPWIT